MECREGKKQRGVGERARGREREKDREKRTLYSPKTRHHAAKQEHAVALHKGGEEGEEAVDRHGYEEALFAAHLV